MRLLCRQDAVRAGIELDLDDLDDLYGVARQPVDGRPWVGICMVSSLDGSTVVDGTSGGLGNATDRAVFAALRRAADVILVGSATAAAEHYRPPKRPDQRIGVITRRGQVDTTTDLFRSGQGFLVMPNDAPVVDGVESVRAGHGTVDVAAALAQIAEWPSAPRFVQTEGGASVNGAFLDAGCVDELNASIAPVLVGGVGPRITRDAAATVVAMTLAHTITDDDGYLFTRWIRSDAAPPTHPVDRAERAVP